MLQLALASSIRLRDEAVRRDEMQRNAALVIDRLEKLIALGRQQLGDVEAIPSAYGTIADDLAQELAAARTMAASMPEGDTAASNLRALIDLGDQVRMQLTQRAQIWQQFVRDRDDANARLDALHNVLNKAISNPQQPMEAVQDDVERLKVRQTVSS
jgi:hypothetical protein